MPPARHQQQLDEAEALFGERLGRASFAKGLYFGAWLEDKLPRYPLQVDSETEAMVARLREFCAQSIDAAAIDRQAEIPRAVIDGLGQLGVLGACLPLECGGRGLSQTSYCRLLEVLGGHCGSTALFVNAHHSIGPRALVLFGTRQQQARWLPKLASGEWISAFALTEPEAGSDAGNVQTSAVPTEDGRALVVEGQKRWITNGGIAQVLTVMARTPAMEGRPAGITALVVTPDLPGFEVVERRMEKCGVRGTATARLAFRGMRVPRENVLGAVGGGLKVALTVLDFGRTTFGASCTGAARFCVEQARRHAATRRQFGQTLGTFELVKEKLAFMAAGAWAMEAMTYQTAAVIDAGRSEYMLETAMLKVFATETLWRIVNDTIQIFGGQAYFCDQPYERMLRDARINQIGEGANDVLRVFVALAGLRDVGLELQGLMAAVRHPLGNLTKLGRFAGQELEALFAVEPVPVLHSELEPEAHQMGRLLAELRGGVRRSLRQHREAILDRQFVLGRLADAATELYASACVLRRLDAVLGEPAAEPQRRSALLTGRCFLRCAARRIRQALAALADHDDAVVTELADDVLARP
jgi:alkylation response protein AidB-like acyl-CoA dehydrogenase